ncbi:hypothetical protein BD779DRAFT_626529 [Infundibulicybe gibba]|nr:hypothetical protein BD779DRAFT_626529 [Infundibulicybe gibba]
MRAIILPLPLFILTCISLLLSAVVFALALFSYSILSEWLSAVTALFTIIYHAVIVILAWRRRLYPGNSRIQHRYHTSVAYSAPSVTCLFFICAMWIISVGIAAELVSGGPVIILEKERNARWNNGVQIAGLVLMTVEVVATAITFAYCFRARRRCIRHVNLSKLKGKGKSVPLHDIQMEEKQLPHSHRLNRLSHTRRKPCSNQKTNPNHCRPCSPSGGRRPRQLC